MKKRTKVADGASKPVAILETNTETTEKDKINLSKISKPKSVISNSNEISAVSDSLAKEKKRQEKDIKLIYKKLEEGLQDGTIDKDEGQGGGWTKIEFTLDQQMPICKDYHDTGYCTFGGACKYLHTRDDVVSSSQMDEQAGWKAFHESCDKADAERLKKKVTLEPDVCQICHKLLKDPVICKCGHKFCSSCALRRYQTDTTCAICGKDTEGVFNTAPVE